MISISFHVTPGAIATPARSVAGWLSRWTLGLLAWGERRAAIKTLRQLDDRALRDIGLYRGQIEAAVYGSAPWEPRRLG